MASTTGPENGVNSFNTYAAPVLSSENSTLTENELRTRVVIILNSMTEEERRSLINPIKDKSMQPNSELILKNKSSNEDVRVSASFVWQLLLESWSDQCNRDHDAKTDQPKRIPDFPLPKPPRCFGKLSRKMQLLLALSAFALAAIICAGGLFAVLHYLGSESDARPSNFIVMALFQNSTDTTGFDANSLRYDQRQQRAFAASLTNGLMSVLAWNRHQAQHLLFDVGHIIGGPLAEGQRRCSLISITTNNKPVLFCVSPSRINESSATLNLFKIDDEMREIHFPGSDSTHKIVLTELTETDEPVLWYSLQLKNRFSDTFTLTYDAGVGFGRISASDAAFVRIANGFTKEIDKGLDKPWSVYTMRAEKSDNSLNVLHVQPTAEVGGVCNFAYVKNALIKGNCTCLENLFYYFNNFTGNSKIIPGDSLDPPEAMLVRGRYFKEKEWFKVWVVYVTTHISIENNWSPAIGHLYLSLYDMNGNYIGNVTHNTVDDVKLLQQNPTGLVVASTDSLFVWFSGRDGSSSLALYKFTVCFDEKSVNCSPLFFEI